MATSMMLSTSCASLHVSGIRYGRPAPFMLPACSRQASHAAASTSHAAAVVHQAQTRRTLPICGAAATTNPAFTMGRINEAVYDSGGRRRPGEVMTEDGAIRKALLMLGVVALAAAATWMQVYSGRAGALMAVFSAARAAGIVAMVSAMATMYKPQWAPITGLIFAASKGVALGAASAIMELSYPGIALNAVMLTLGTAASLFAAHQARIISVTDNFRSGLMMVSGGYLVASLGAWLLSFTGLRVRGLLSSGPVGIGLTLMAGALAAGNLLMDLNMIRQAARQRLPKWFEWYGGFSLMVTLVWMYTEVLRLLALMNGGGSRRERD